MDRLSKQELIDKLIDLGYQAGIEEGIPFIYNLPYLIGVTVFIFPTGAVYILSEYTNIRISFDTHLHRKHRKCYQCTCNRKY